MRKLRVHPLWLILLLVFQLNVFAQHDKQHILRLFEETFGKSIDTTLNLYEANELFVVRPEFESNDTLFRISVVPKYWFEDQHPEWKEPDARPHLNRAGYDAVVAKINSIKPFGKVLGNDSEGVRVAVITNFTDYRHEYYENGDLEYLESFYWDKETNKERIRAIYINLFHYVEGKIDGKRFDKYSNREPFLVAVGEKNYYVDKTTYGRLKKGKVNVFQGILAPDYVNFYYFGKKRKPFKLKFQKEKSQ